MSARFAHAIGSRLSLVFLTAAVVAACSRESESTAPEVRPVRTVTVVKRESGETVAFTGRIEAENETRLAFRIGGRMIERAANVGDRLEPDQVVARLDPQDQLNSLRAAQAGVAAAQAQFADPRASSSASDFCWRGTSIPAPNSSGRSRPWRPRGRNSKRPRHN